MTVVPLKTYTIGGSDAAAAAGVHPYCSRVELFMRKRGEWPDDGRDEALHWGTVLEPLIFARLEQLGYELMPAPVDGFSDAERAWRVCHPDGFAVVDGARAVLDIKTTNTWAHRANGAVPVQYDAQLQHNMHLTGDSVGLLATLVGGQRLEIHEVERNEHNIDLLLGFEEEFYGFLERGECPAPDGSDSAREALSAMWPTAERDRVVRLTREQMDVVYDLRLIRETQDKLKAQRTEKENLLKQAMGDAELAIAPNDYDVIRWTNNIRTTLDSAALKRTRPDIYSEYSETTQLRRFTLL